MLLSLNIKNFAVFEDVSVNFDAGSMFSRNRVRKIRVNQCYTVLLERGHEGPDKKGQKSALLRSFEIRTRRTFSRP